MGEPPAGGPQYFVPPPAPSGRNVGLIVGLAAGAVVIIAVLAAAVFLVLDEESDGKPRGTGSTQLTRPMRFQIVSKVAQPPCESGMQTDIEGRCYSLGTQLMDVTQVKDLRPEPPNPQQGQSAWSVRISLTAADTTKFAELTRVASQNYQQDPGSPGGQIAIVAAGRIEAAPQVNGGPILGGQVSIYGPPDTFTQQYVRDLVDRLSG